MIKKETISFTIQNTTAGAIPVTIFGNPSNLADNSNATTQYSWDVTSLVITNQNTIELQYAMAGAITLQVATLNFSGTTRQDVVDALNTLGLGGFGLAFSGGNWYIYNFNLTFQFGWLNIYNPTIVPTTLSGFLTDPADTLNLDINFVNVAAFAGVVPITGTYNAAIGDTFSVNGTAGALGLALWIYQRPDNILLSNILAPAFAPYNFNWVAQATKNYDVQSFP